MTSPDTYGKRLFTPPREVPATSNDGRHPRDLDQGRKVVDLDELEQAVNARQAEQNWQTNGPKRMTLLEELAAIFAILPYGDMIEFTTATGADPAKVWDWATKERPAHPSTGGP